jgi:TonB-dependent receptor
MKRLLFLLEGKTNPALLFVLLLFLLLLSGSAAAQPDVQKQASRPGGVMGKIIGTVVNEKGKPVGGARVEVEEITQQTAPGDARISVMADKNGGYSLNLPPGTYKLIITAPGLETKIVDGVTVTAEAVRTANATLLSAATVQIEEMKVVGKAKKASELIALSRRKSMSNVMDSMSAETIVKIPESDVAGILTRMPGVVLDQGKYMQARGMPKRYNKTTLNNSILPSTRPNERETPLDLFPAGILDYVNVVKTFSPDLQGNFSGGLCQIQTKAIPEKFTAKLSATANYNDITTFRKRLTYHGGSKDWLGYDDGTRDLPGIIPSDKPVRRGNFTPLELERYGEAFPNNYSTYTRNAPLNGDYSFYIGNKFNKVGANLVLNYKNEMYNRADEQLNTYSVTGSGELRTENSYKFQRSFQYIKEGGMFNVGFDLSPDHKLYISQFYDRNATDEARIYEGFNADKATDVRVTRLRWLEEQIYTGQLAGDHTIAPLLESKIKWHYNYSLATLYDPDMRDYFYLLDNKTKEYNFALDTENPLRQYTEQDERMHDASLDWNITLPGTSWLAPKFQTGAAYNYRKREFNSRRFAYDKRSVKYLDLTKPVEELLIPPNINPYEFELFETTRPTDSYIATEQTAAGYSMLDMTFFKKVQLVAGGRIERNDINVTTFNLFRPEETLTTVLQEDSWLPSYSLKYSPIDDVNIRFNYSKTVARPEFHELAPFEFTDVIGGTSVKGNPDLQVAKIKNYDFRAEWFINKTDLLAFSVFYKDISNAIEPTIQPTTQLRLSWTNADSAYLRGVEFEFKKNLEFLSRHLNYFSLMGSYVYSESETEIEPSAGFVPTEPKRPLVGQPDNLVNLTLEYDNPNWGFTGRFMYKFTDERISSIGALGLPDVILDKQDRFDFVLIKKLGKSMEMKFVAQNISDEPITYLQGGQIFHQYREGRTYKLGISYKW